MKKINEKLIRNFKGVWISKEIWLDKNLTLQEKVLLTEIDSLDNEEGCFASNGYFSDFFGLSKSRIGNIINELVKKGYINSTLIYKENSKEVDKRVLMVSHIREGGISETQIGYLGNSEDSNISNNIKEPNVPFIDFWEVYNFKVGKSEAEKKWLKLKDQDRLKIMDTVEIYVDETLGKNETSDVFKPMRKNASTYLNQKVWKDYEKEDLTLKKGSKKENLTFL